MSVLNNAAVLLLGAEAGGGGGYEISRSVRFNSSDSAYLSRTPASAGNRKTWTWAGWVKRSGSNRKTLFFAGAGDGEPTVWISFGNNVVDTLEVTLLSQEGVSTESWTQTLGVFRDYSAWYHIVCAVDTTQATASDRVKIYVNGVLQSVQVGPNGSLYPSQNFDTAVNNTVAHNIGRRNLAGGDFYFDGYLADVYLIDGQQLTPTSFGEFDTNGVWQPKAYAGSYGTNGFHLDFADNSSAAALGYDAAGSNDWTVNNISVAAGAGNDSLVDTPTNYGTGNSGGDVRGNYATLNPLSPASNNAPVNGNLDQTVVGASGGTYGSSGSIVVVSGKFYWEVSATHSTSDYAGYVGIKRGNLVGSPTAIATNPGGVYYYATGGSKYIDGTSSSYGTAWTTTSTKVIGVALDADAGTLTFYLDGVSQGAITLPSNTTGWAAHHGFYSGNASNNCAYVYNFGQRPFAYTAPSGYKALCTTNLPAPVVAKPSTVMDVKLYTGNGSTQTISGLSFSPDLVWIKERNAAADHALYDSVRGVQQQLESNTTTDETTESTGLTAFNSDGFALSSLAQVNTNTDTYVAWCWDESATAGFDIVTYTGNGSARTISHGLGVAPNMIIVKARTTASTDQGWPVYHSANTAAPATDYLLLNSTAATADLDTVWNDTAPTSSVFSVGTNALVNTNNDTYVAYLFSAVVGYSSFGSYAGNGSTDGPFVYTGFRPRWVMVKRTDSTGNWVIMDAKRDEYNYSRNYISANLSDAEGTFAGNGFSLLSNGFKLEQTTNSTNDSGGTYIYAAFAENPFSIARAR